MRALAVGVLCAAAAAQAGTMTLGNDTFSGSGTVNSAVEFSDYEGAAVLISPSGGYPLKLIGVDVLDVTFMGGASGLIAAYQLDVWDETQGSVAPPMLFDGGNYPARDTEFVELTTSTTQFNRITLMSPIMITSGRIFISLGEQTSTSLDNATVALDTGAQVPGGNWYRYADGTFVRLDQPDGGFYKGINHNWIMRAVFEVSGANPTVTSIFPNSGLTTTTTPVMITGTNFEQGATVFIGTTAAQVTGSSPPTGVMANVPPGITPGVYDVKVQNPSGPYGLLQNGFQVLDADGGSGTGGGAGGGSGAGGGGATGGGAGGGGGFTEALRIDSVTPSTAYNEETTTLVIAGGGFQAGAQVVIGPATLGVVDVKSAAVIDAVISPGVTPGTYDLSVINLDGHTAVLPMGFTVKAGTRTKSGCGCTDAPSAAAFMLLALLFLTARARARPAPAAVRRERRDRRTSSPSC
jgi:hypothetical protein